jgi:hypothetical protein
MKKSVLALAALAAIGFTGVAFAGNSTGAWSTSTATAPTAMSDSDMDKVTAGAPGTDVGKHYGGGTGSGHFNNKNAPITSLGTVGKGQGAGNNNANGRF